MPCCGQRRGRRRPPKAGPATGTERVLAAYVGARDCLFSIRGPATGEKYHFSCCPTERLGEVWVEDLEGLAALGVLRVEGPAGEGIEEA